jgi:glycosyltransferase involved in cell wall biosynthesis
VTRARMHEYASEIGELHIISPAKPDAVELQEGGLVLHPVSAWKIFLPLLIAWKGRRLVRKHGIELVSAQDPFELGLAALRATHWSDAKLHIQVHTDFLSPWFVHRENWSKSQVRAWLLNKYRLHIARRVIKNARGIRVVSDALKTALLKEYGNAIPEPVVIPIAVASDTPEKVSLPPHNFKFAVICVGRLEPEKRVGDIIKALKLVRVKYNMIGLIIVGEGSERSRLQKLVRTMELTPWIQFLGARSDAPGLMRSAQAFVQASAYEGYGRTFIEAALAQVPIIATPVGIIGSVLKDKEDVLVVPVKDPVAIARSIGALIEDNALRHSLPVHAEMAVLEHLKEHRDIPRRFAEHLAYTYAHL